MTRTLLLEGTMTALTSISHIGETYGISAKLRRERVAQPSGTVEEVPILSGNALRGLLRDRGMLHMLRALGYGVNEQTGEVRGLSLAAFYFLFSGGALSKMEGRGLDVAVARTWRETVPLVAIFGGALGNHILPGKVKIGKAIPICQETAHLLPERFVLPPVRSIWSLLQEESYTRRDDEKQEGLRSLIAPAERQALEVGRAARASAPEEPATDVGQHQQMRYYVETLIAGTTFFWDIVLDDVTDVEFEAFLCTMMEFARFPYVGGKSGVGHGKVALHFDSWLEVDPHVRSGQGVSLVASDRYLAHLQTNATAIRGLFDALQ